MRASPTRNSANAANAWPALSRAQGIQPGDRVAYLSFNTHKLLEGYYGVVMARAIVMPLNVRLTPVELINILNHSGAQDAPLRKRFRAARRGDPQMLPRQSRNSSISTTANTKPSSIAARPQPPRLHDVDENAIAELFYTSGSTGTPKGVMLSHRTLYLHALAVYATFIKTTPASSCTPSRCSTPTAGDVRRPPPWWASSRSWCGASNPRRS